MMQQISRIQRGRLAIDEILFNFVEQEVLPKIGQVPELFWSEFETLLTATVPENKALLTKRTELQAKIDAYHKTHPTFDFEHYKMFLQDIGYLVPAPADFAISSDNVDDEIARIAGPQLVVPVMNARYALNAANARWGSLYDALYGTDVISEEQGAEKGTTYNPVRGQKVVAYGRDLLNDWLPLSKGDWTQITGFNLSDEGLSLATEAGQCTLLTPSAYKGHQGPRQAPTALLFKHNDLHLIIELDKQDKIGASDKAGIKDLRLESAITTIMDCEDSVAAVDAEDKTLVYRNWFGLMQGTLTENVRKQGQTFTRSMNEDLCFEAPNGEPYTLPGRALMFVRNVGHLMTNPAILFDGEEIPEGIMDAVFTSAIGKLDLLKTTDAAIHNSPIRNSRQGSIYIVKPKMHGPEEVAFSHRLFNAVEDMLGLERYTLKMGIMDEERRTSVNLKACVFEAKARVVFINTGFLDRTGDEIHTSMLAGPFAAKAELKALPWIQAYEASNVAVGLTAGFKGKAQIGKGMWPIPDQMAAMMDAKVGHVTSGATTAWVPSPTAATLHAIHYHQHKVANIQDTLKTSLQSDIDGILQIPLLKNRETLTPEAIQAELDNNAQGILGYVVRWVDFGVGCSKVPDINNIGLMEDRATCRISSQHMANWLAHGLCDEAAVVATMKKMAKVVDEQNAKDPDYQPMSDNFDTSIAFNAALDLVIKGAAQPSGYTEPLLHQARLNKKQRQ